MKTTIRILTTLFLLPGFIFDVLVGIAFLMGDKGSDLGEWAFAMMKDLVPCGLGIPLMLSVYICAIPAGIVCVVVPLVLLFATVYLVTGVGLTILQMPFTGKIKWVSIMDI